MGAWGPENRQSSCFGQASAAFSSFSAPLANLKLMGDNREYREGQVPSFQRGSWPLLL